MPARWAAQGGEVTLRMLPGQPRYPGTTRNGIASSNYGAWQASYRFEGVAQRNTTAAPTPGAPAPSPPPEETESGADKVSQMRRPGCPAAAVPECSAVLPSTGSCMTGWGRRRNASRWELHGGRVPPEPRTTRGGQPDYSPLAILTALTLRAVFRLPFRQTEGLIGSVIGLLGLDLAVPDHTTLCRRAETLEVPRPRPRSDGEPVHLLVDSTGLRLCGPGEWLVEKHGTRTRRSWRKLVWGFPCQAFIAATPL